MFRKLMATVLIGIFALTTINIGTVFAMESERDTFHQELGEGVDIFDDFSQQLSLINTLEVYNIPFFVVEDEFAIGIAKEYLSDVLSNFQQSIDIYERNRSFDVYLDFQTLSRLGVRQLADVEVSDLFDNPIYAPTLARLQQLLDEGTTVNYIIIPAALSSLASYGLATYVAPHNAPGQFLNNHNGFEFRFLNSSVFSITTSRVRQVDTTMNWSQFTTAWVEVGFDVISSMFHWPSTIMTLVGHAGNFMGSVNSPFNIRISNTLDTFTEHQFIGHLSTRIIFIQDRNNRDPHNAFIPLGHVDRLDGRMHFTIRYPIRMEGNRVTLTNTRSFNSPQIFMWTNGWLGHPSSLDNIIHHYNMPVMRPYTELLGTRPQMLRMFR